MKALIPGDFKLSLQFYFLKFFMISKVELFFKCEYVICFVFVNKIHQKNFNLLTRVIF